MNKTFGYSLSIIIIALAIVSLLVFFQFSQSKNLYQNYDEASEFIIALEKFDYGELEKQFVEQQKAPYISTVKSQLILAYHHTRLREMERAALLFEKINQQLKTSPEQILGQHESTFRSIYKFVDIQLSLWIGKPLPKKLKDITKSLNGTQFDVKLNCLINVSSKLNKNTFEKLFSARKFQKINECDKVSDNKINQLLHYSNYHSDRFFSLAYGGVKPGTHRLLAIEIFNELENNSALDKYNKISGYKVLFEEARMLKENSLSLYSLMKLRSVLETNGLFNISRSVEHAIDFSGSFT